MIRFSGCPNSRASSIVIRGANSHVLDEAQRSLHDALCVLSQTVKATRVLPGGGATGGLDSLREDAECIVQRAL